MLSVHVAIHYYLFFTKCTEKSFNGRIWEWQRTERKRVHIHSVRQLRRFAPEVALAIPSEFRPKSA